VIAVDTATIAAQLVTFFVMMLRRLPWIVRLVSRRLMLTPGGGSLVISMVATVALSLRAG